MGTYIIPRNVKGESRILLFFTPKSFLFMVIGIVIGAILYYILKLVGAGTVGLVVLAIVTIISVAIGTLKIPDSNAFNFTKKVGGESVDEIIIRYFKFRKNRKLYVYSMEKEKYIETKE